MWHKMLYGCIHMTTVAVKGLIKEFQTKDRHKAAVIDCSKSTEIVARSTDNQVEVDPEVRAQSTTLA